MRLIDADKLVYELTELVRTNTGEYKNGIAVARLVVMDSPTVGGWISVKDRLPENADHPGAFCPRYQVMTKYGMTEGWYNPDKGCWYTLCWFLIGRYDEDDIDMDRGDIPRITDKLDVTHWMPLPEPPKEEGHEGY